MSTAVFFALIAILCEVSAENVTTSLLIPDALFLPAPRLQTFTGETSVSGRATYYTLDCGDYRDPTVNFAPGEYGCTDNSYTISADSANTRFIIPNVTVETYFSIYSGAAPSQLEAFSQTVTINCAPANANSTATCFLTSLYNNENPTDSSMISPTLVTQSTIEPQSNFYPVIITAIAAATPTNTLASATTANPISPKPSSSSSPSSSTLGNSSLSTGAKAGIGVGVPLGILALAGIALLLYSHKKHKQPSRLSQEENLMQFEGRAGEFERKEVGPPDNSGVYEMQGRTSPVQVGELESPTHGGEIQG